MLLLILFFKAGGTEKLPGLPKAMQLKDDTIAI